MAQALFTNEGPRSTLKTRRKKDTGIPAERRGVIAAAYGALIANRHQNTGLLQKRKYHNLETCIGKAAKRKPPIQCKPLPLRHSGHDI
jgi:hypothetical protein